MTQLWNAWLLRMDRQMDPRPLAMVRIALPLCVLADLARLAQLGLLSSVFTPYAHGGLSRIDNPNAILWDWFGPSGPWLGLGLTAACMVLVAIGRWMRPAIVVGVLAYAQLGHLYPPGDRAIDRMVRTALLILLFSHADKALVWGRTMVRRIPAWPAWFLRFFLVLVYLSAGMGKLLQQPGWVSLNADPPLLRILTDPMAASLDPAFWAPHAEWFRWAGFATIALELSSPLLLTRAYPYWAVFGLLMHLGIWATMSLGMFSAGMIALYPVLLAPFILRRWPQSRAE